MCNNGLIRVICVDNCPRDVTSVFMKSRCGKQCRSLTRSTIDSADSASNFNCEILKRQKCSKQTHSILHTICATCNYCQKIERHKRRLSRLSSSTFSLSVLRSLIHRMQLNLTYLGKKLLPTAYSDADRSLLAYQPFNYRHTSRKNQHSSEYFPRHCTFI